MTQQARPWERHLQTVLSGLVLAAILWGYQSISALHVLVAEQAVEIRALRERIEYQMADRFTGAEGQAMNDRIGMIERRLEDHERRIDDLSTK